MSTTEQTSNLHQVDEAVRTLCERARRFEDDADPYLRGLVATEVYRDLPGMPVVRKRAEILARTLERLDPVVLPEERIVGAAYRQFRVHPGVSDPDAWRIRALHPDRWGFDERWPLPEHVRKTLSWWQEQKIGLHGINAARREHSWMMRYGVAHPHGLVQGHTLPDHAILLDAGIARLRERIAGRLAGEVTQAQRDQLLAMDRCLEGLSRHCLRCAARAREKAAEVADPALRRHLTDAAANCEVVAISKPQTFAQALQLAYFSNFADRLDTPGDASSFGRLDQILAPFYRADRREGRLTEQDAFDLVCHFIAKKWCLQDSNNITVGGLTPSGEDATNEVSFLLLEAMETTGMPMDMSVRLHAASPPQFVRTAARVLRRGFGRPSLYNDNVAVEALMRAGVAPEDARDYAPLGCVELMIPGRSAFRTMCMGMNLPKVLELTLNRGRCLVTGDVVWDDVPDNFASYDELVAEYHARVQRVIDAAVDIIHEDERIEPDVFPRPYLSVLSRGGVEDALDVTAGQPKYDPVGVTLKGIADIANSLLALRRLVFDEKRLTLEEFRRILRDDWQGHEELRQRVVNGMPRFGEDEPEVDAIAQEEAAHYCACWRGHRTYYGGHFWPMIFGVGTTMLSQTSPRTGATPSGRRRADMLSMSLQPSPAGPRGAPTEMLRSVAAIDFRDFPGGVSNVQELDPALASGQAGLDLLTDLVRGFFDMGGMELSLNLLDEKTLREAQKNPERFRHLTVRLFGLSAHFVRLSPELQETIIERAAAAQRQAGA